MNIHCIYICEYIAVVFYKIQYPDLRPPTSHFVCYTWGGLRGALPLLLSFELYHQHLRAEFSQTNEFAAVVAEMTQRNLVIVCGSVIMSLMLQGTMYVGTANMFLLYIHFFIIHLGLSFESVLNKMGLTRETEYTAAVKKRVMKHIKKAVDTEMENMKKDVNHAGTNWGYVNDVRNAVII